MEQIGQQTLSALKALLSAAELKIGDILVVGCSTSEIMGERIGKNGNMDAAKAVLSALLEGLSNTGVYLAVQCCEHLNRALVVESECARANFLEPVCAVPHEKAGGSLATAAMKSFQSPVLVEHIAAHAGMDIGDTLIGMQLRPVAVPLRFEGVDKIGCARVVFAKTRPKYIGGPRARYDAESCQYAHEYCRITE